MVSSIIYFALDSDLVDKIQPVASIYRNSITGDFHLQYYASADDHPPGTYVDVYSEPMTCIKDLLVPITPAAVDVLEERKRQIDSEGYTVEKDDYRSTGELAIAGACYATRFGNEVPMRWPLSPDSWKPGDYRRNLVKAAALILAEIERQDRMLLD
jgi:hypothetical protein